MPEPDAWSLIERVFPGISRPFIKLLIAARGVIEGSASMTPMLFTTGPTGCGKSLSVFLAASICGDKNTEVVWTVNTDRLRQSIIDARGSFVTFNEIFKEAQTAKSTNAIDFVLNLTPDSVSHYMYTGPVRMGRLPVIVLTDTELLARIKQDAQLARRITHVRLTSEVDWETTLKRTGIGHPSHFRCSSEEHAEACNSVVSSVIDEFFQTPHNFEDIAEQLGFQRLSKSDEAKENRDVLVQLFNAVCEAPALSGTDATRWPGRGWVVVRKDVESEVQRLWLAVCDADMFGSSRRCSEVDWAVLMKATEPVVFECRQYGHKVAFRFKNATASKVNYKVNKELL